jgi:hypothetical protein
MSNAWSGDWEARIHDFVLAQGHPSIWDYLAAHAHDSFVNIAATIGDAAAVQIERLAVDYGLAHGLMPEYIRDRVVRGIHEYVPRRWKTRGDFAHVNALTAAGTLPEPYSQLARAMSQCLMQESPPPAGWIPETRDDPVLLDAYRTALHSLPKEMQDMVREGRWIKPPGSSYWASVEPVWKQISIHDGPVTFCRQFAAVPSEVGHLFAAHWCQSEVCNGGFHQFFCNSTGVLAPEAAAGFAAIGMPDCAAIILEAMGLFGRPYPRQRDARLEKLAVVDGEKEHGSDPLGGLDQRFYDLLDTENGGFDHAADAYARAHPQAE